MTRRTVTYTDRAQRKALIKAAEAAGETVLNEDFIDGAMVLTIVTPDELPPPQVRSDSALRDSVRAKLSTAVPTLTDAELNWLLRRG